MGIKSIYEGSNMPSTQYEFSISIPLTVPTILQLSWYLKSRIPINQIPQKMTNTEF